jgi:hypothetical protein
MNKLQYLLIKELLKTGTVELLLPDGITLEIGITQEDKYGQLKKSDDYCYVVASRDGKSTLLDTYNLGLRFEDEKDILIYEDTSVDNNGVAVRSFDIV